ncbi:hypothetical protein MMC12_000176 [Toensbergia leucococca]|nr:hypothetical protein [Toensbergia leucococca]
MDPLVDSTNRPASMEGLPTELIEKIFFYYPNPNLPLVSRRLLAALSSERIYIEVILSVFADAKDNYCDPAVVQQLRYNSIPWSLTEDKSVLQCMIKDRRLFFNQSRLRQCQLKFMDKVIQTQWIHQGRNLGEANQNMFDSLKVQDRWFFDATTMSGSENEKLHSQAWSSERNPGKYFTIQGEDTEHGQTELHICGRTAEVAIIYWYPPEERSPGWSLFRFQLLIGGQLGQDFLPHKALHGPWTEEKDGLLDLLLDRRHMDVKGSLAIVVNAANCMRKR